MGKYNVESISVIFHILEESVGDKCSFNQFSHNEERTLATGEAGRILGSIKLARL